MLHLGCSLINRPLQSLRNMGPSADHCLTIYMPTWRHTNMQHE